MAGSDMTLWGKAWKIIRSLFSSILSKEVMMFLFFVMLAGFFWLFLTLDDTYEKELAVPVSVVNVPKNVMLTSDETDTIKVTVQDKGYALVAYLYGDVLRHIKVNFQNYSRNNGTGIVPAQEINRLVMHQLAASSKITAIKPERLEFFYNYGAKKVVPVRWNGRVIPEELYFISRVEYNPDSVTIYASESKLDSINQVYTEPLNYVNFRDTLMINCEMNKIKGVKIVPNNIKVTFFTDLLTEERIEGIPVKGINLPEGMILRTFPAKVSVRFVTGASVYRGLRPSDFTVIADYSELRKNPSEKCRLILKDVPRGISRARLETQVVDYLIESE